MRLKTPPIRERKVVQKTEQQRAGGHPRPKRLAKKVTLLIGLEGKEFTHVTVNSVGASTVDFTTNQGVKYTAPTAITLIEWK